MCIRDRRRSERHSGQDVEKHSGVKVTRSGGGEAPGALIIPVSYTHLRAHETVLDLVCRLLLEKKKATTINNTYTAFIIDHTN